jgi:hypothetical protein
LRAVANAIEFLYEPTEDKWMPLMVLLFTHFAPTKSEEEDLTRAGDATARAPCRVGTRTDCTDCTVLIGLSPFYFILFSFFRKLISPAHVLAISLHYREVKPTVDPRDSGQARVEISRMDGGLALGQSLLSE